MTLILGLLTDDYVALASDRRVTWTQDDKIIRQDDSDTKAILLGGYWLMGYTGAARIGGQPTDAWVTQLLVGTPESGYFGALRQGISRAFEQDGLTGKKPHAFFAVGWARDSTSHALVPARVVISNAIDASGDWTPQSVDDKFWIYSERLGNRRQLLREVGYQLPVQVREQAEDAVRTALKGAPAKPGLALGPLVWATRETAAVSGGHVGANVLLATLPRASVPAAHIDAPLNGNVTDWDGPISLFSRAEAPEIHEAELFAPAIVNPMFAMRGVEISSQPLPPPRRDPR